MKSHTFMGKRYLVTREPDRASWGTCDPPETTEKTINIRPRQGGRELLNTLIHEGLHACEFKWDEASIGQAADSIEGFVTRYLRAYCGFDAAQLRQRRGA